MKNKNALLSEQFQNHRKMQNRYPCSTQIHDRSLSWLGTGTSMYILRNSLVLPQQGKHTPLQKGRPSVLRNKSNAQPVYREHYVSCSILCVWVVVLNVAFNNISAISWPLVLLVEESGVSGEKTPTCLKSLTNFIT